MPFALIGLMAIGSRVDAQVAGMPAGGGGHQDMFYGAPTVPVKIVWDSRFKDVPVQVAPKAVPAQGTLLLIEGDIVVGKQDDLVRTQLNQFRDRAKSIDLTNPRLKIDNATRDLISKLQALPEQPRDIDLKTARAHDEIEKLFKDCKLLLAGSGNSSALPPEIARSMKIATGENEAAAIALTGSPQAAILSDNMMAQYRWPKGVIPYVIAPGVPAGLSSTIEDAVAHWNKATDRIYIRPYRNGDPYWVQFTFSDGCNSPVGKTVSSGPQVINLGMGCLFDQVVHEIGHSVGMYHEQSRTDRDTYIDIVYQYVMQQFQSQFDLNLKEQAQNFGPFDFSSVMLYGPSSFSIDVSNPNDYTIRPKANIVAKVGWDWGINFRDKVGLRGLSKGDVAGVIAMYPKAADRSATLDLATLTENRGASPPASAPPAAAPVAPSAAEAAVPPAPVPGSNTVPPPAPPTPKPEGDAPK